MDLKNPTRTEALLANIAGYTDVPVPDMKNATRSERLLKEILDNGGGGGGDVTKEYVDTAIADAVADIDDDISALSDTVADKVDKVNGKGLSTNDYTDADKALVQDSPITVTATASPISTANGKPRKLAIYGKSEIVDGAIKSAGEGWSVVDLGTLTWNYATSVVGTKLFISSQLSNIKRPLSLSIVPPIVCAEYTVKSWDALNTGASASNGITIFTDGSVRVVNSTYTDPEDFKTAMSGVILCYQLADPTQDNTIAIKTDNGTGINGTMAVFETGTPLRGIPNTDVRDVMMWDGSSGEVTKVCGEVDLGTLSWAYYSSSNTPIFYSTLSSINGKSRSANMLCPLYTPEIDFWNKPNNDMKIATSSSDLFISNSQYTNPADFKTAMNGVMLVYELATPTIEQLTTAENASIAGLRTFEPQTHIQNNAQTDMTVEAYAGTQNGKAVADLKSELQITQSDTLTLTVAGWSNNAQTVTFAHDIGKRNTIDVEPASIKAWTAAGILATAETTSTITFECDTVPTADLSFRVTSMEVR